ncbi:MAG: phosphatase PAP2 family protein [Proteobacteria bacterium]|nr:phosphatase PAP2 family protein [Pseudomonadota bacterium]
MKKLTRYLSVPLAAAAIVVSANNANAGGINVFTTRGKGGIEIAGDWMQFAIPLSALVYSMAISDWSGSLQFAGAYASTYATTELMKHTICARRPDTPDGVCSDGFPSGHTSSAFAGAAFWQMRYGWYIGAPMYAAAAFVGYSRIESNNHYWWQVLAGAAIGYGFNYLITTKYVPAGSSVSVNPAPGGATLNFNMRF